MNRLLANTMYDIITGSLLTTFSRARFSCTTLISLRHGFLLPESHIPAVGKDVLTGVLAAVEYITSNHEDIQPTKKRHRKPRKKYNKGDKKKHPVKLGKNGWIIGKESFDKMEKENVDRCKGLFDVNILRLKR